jgi:hypothetical protein
LDPKLGICYHKFPLLRWCYSSNLASYSISTDSSKKNIQLTIDSNCYLPLAILLAVGGPGAPRGWEPETGLSPSAQGLTQTRVVLLVAAWFERSYARWKLSGNLCAALFWFAYLEARRRLDTELAVFSILENPHIQVFRAQKLARPILCLLPAWLHDLSQILGQIAFLELLAAACLRWCRYCSIHQGPSKVALGPQLLN